MNSPSQNKRVLLSAAADVHGSADVRIPAMQHSWKKHNWSVAERELIKKYPGIRKSLRNWFIKQGRSFPWRKTNNWFHLLMAEMMLRRTRADQVVPVYKEFIDLYKSPLDTGQLSRRALSEMLYPLGLAWRATHVYETLEYLRDHHPRRRPANLGAFRAIPGVGDYSAAMLANRLLGMRIAAIDVNVARFHARLLGHEADAESRRKKHILALANRFVNSPHAADLNLAILDLAALICKARRPLCDLCPVQKKCMMGTAYASQN